MNYYISDMHFFHKNVTKEGNNFDKRPFNSLAEMHQYMKEKWNSTNRNSLNLVIQFIFLEILPCGVQTRS